MYLDEEGNQVNHIVTTLHPVLHLDDNDDYVDDDLLIDILDVVMDNPQNDFKGLDMNYNLGEPDIELDEVQHNLIWICNRYYIIK